jgi:hypothetical protein
MAQIGFDWTTEWAREAWCVEARMEIKTACGGLQLTILRTESHDYRPKLLAVWEDIQSQWNIHDSWWRDYCLTRPPPQKNLWFVRYSCRMNTEWEELWMVYVELAVATKQSNKHAACDSWGLYDMKTKTFFRNVTPLSLVEIYHCFGENCLLHLQFRKDSTSADCPCHRGIYDIWGHHGDYCLPACNAV